MYNYSFYDYLLITSKFIYIVIYLFGISVLTMPVLDTDSSHSLPSSKVDVTIKNWLDRYTVLIDDLVKIKLDSSISLTAGTFDTLSHSILALNSTLSSIRDTTTTIDQLHDLYYKGKAVRLDTKYSKFRRFKKREQQNFLFDGLLGAFERIINAAINVFLNAFIDCLKIIVQTLLDIIIDLLPVFEVLVDFVMYLIEKIFELLIIIYQRLDSKYFLTESLFTFVLTYYYFKDLSFSILITVIVFIFLGLIKRT